MNGWLVFFVLLAAYVGVVFALRRRVSATPGRGLEVNGPLIMWRTQFGKPTLERLARHRRVWNGIADFGIVLTWITGIAIFALLLYQLSLYFTVPETVAQNAPPPEFLIGLPGVNPLIPVWYGLAALIVALVIHEGAHGVMAYVARMRVKSLGLVFFIVPIGAFVEPDEEDLGKATAREQNRVFAAGPTSNLLLALLTGLLLSTVFLGSVSVANGGEGVGIGSVVAGSAAEDAGLRAGDILVALNGQRLAGADDYVKILNASRPGQQLQIEYLRDGATRTATATLDDKYAYVERTSPDQNDPSFRNKGFLGVSSVNLGFLGTVHGVLENPFASGFPRSFSMGSETSPPGSFIFYISYPFVIFITGVDILSPPYQDFLTVEGPMAALPTPVFFGIATLLYWIVWINVMLGTFNALPAGPLDGGQMFRTTLRDRLIDRYRVDRGRIEVQRADLGGIEVRGQDVETQQKLDRIQHVVKRATTSLGLFILALILLPLFGPRLLQLVV